MSYRVRRRMMLLSDGHIGWKRVVRPWSTHRDTDDDGARIFSYGQDGYSYSLRLGTRFKVPNPAKAGLELDPLNLEDDDFLDVDCSETGYILVPAGGFVLGHIAEYLDIPVSHLAMFFGKSSYARVGVNPMVTPGEPGWRGDLVVEIVNNWPGRPVRVYCHQGILAMALLRGEQPCLVSYTDRQGRYQGQQGIQLPR